MKKLFMFLIAVCFFTAIFGQTVLISPTGAGGFELGTTFTANGWTTSNSANNPWVLGTYVSTAPFSNRSAYVSNDAGATNNYSNSNIGLNYFYRDVVIPAGETGITLSFNWVCTGESTWDLIQVFASSTSITPTGTTTYPGSGLSNVPSGITGATFIGSANLQSTIQTATFSIPGTFAGTTMRLIFAWKNDGSGGSNPGGSIDNISLVSSLPSPTTCPTSYVPVTGATGVLGSQTLSWSGATGSPTPTYDVYFGTNSTLVAAKDASVKVLTGTSATSYSPTLSLSTTYYWMVVPGNGVVGSPTTCTVNSFTTTAPATYTASTYGGLWNDAATWVGGIVPAAGNDIVIPSGSIVTINQAVTTRDLTISGILQWGSSSFALTSIGNVVVNSGGRFLAYTSGGTGQTINFGGNFTNNGYTNFAVSSTLISFNGSQQTGGSLTQTLSGTGYFEGDGTNGLIRQLFFQTTGSSTIATTQNLIATSGFAHTAGSLSTNNKLSINNNAQVFGQPINNQVASVAVTTMGVGYTNAPVVFGASASPWAASTALTLNSRYFSGNNVYLCTVAGTTGSIAPTSTASSPFSDGTATLLYIGAVGTLGNPFQQTAVTLGTQYFYAGNLYVCTTAGVPSASAPPIHTSGIVSSGAAAFLYKGSPAKVSVNYEAPTMTVRSLTLVSQGSGYISSAPSLVFNLNGGTVTTAATATVVFFQQIAGPANSSTQKSAIATITGSLNIVSDQAVGGITTSNGGTNYSAAPSVGFSLPTGFLNLVTAGGSGYTSAPTVTVSGGTTLTGFTNPTFTVVVAQGKVVSVICSGGGTLWTSAPTLTLTGGGGTGATCAFPAGCLPQANAVLTDGTITNFTLVKAGFGYASAPTVGLVTVGTVGSAATAPTARIGLYNLTLGYFAPAGSIGNAVHTESVVIPTNRRINVFTMNSALGATFTGNLELYGSSPLTLTNGKADFGTNTITFSYPTYTGTTGSTTSSIAGFITLNSPGGSVTRTFPFDAAVAVATGTGSLATGSSITTLTASRTGAPSGVNAIGTRAYRVQTNAGAVYGTNPTVQLNWNGNDNLLTDQVSLLIAQSTASSGPWTNRSVGSGTGALPATGNRTTATTAPGPIVPTGDDYFAWTSTYIPPPALSYSIARTTGITYTSVISTGTVLGWSGTSTDDQTSPAISIPSSTFTYQGEVVTGFNMCTNGWIKLITATDPATTSSAFGNVFAASGISRIIAPFWDDLTTNPHNSTLATLNSNTRYQIIGSTPGSRQIVCEWYNYTVYGAAGPQLNFQVVLDETDNSITFNYGLFQGFNGTNNHRYTYSCGIGGALVSAGPIAGQLYAQQYENTNAFSHENARIVNVGSNGLLSIPECNTSIKFTPGAYAGFTPPTPTPPVNDEATGAITIPALSAFPSNLCGNFYTSRFATASSQTVCAGTADDDVWFKFTAVETNTTVRIYGSGGYVPRIQVLDASLNPLSTPICLVGASGGSQIDAAMTGLSVGSLYYVRVYHDGGGVQATGTAVLAGDAVASVTMTNVGSGYTSTTTPSGGVLTARVRFTGGGGSDAVGTVVLTSGTVSSITVNNGGSGYTSAPTVTIESPAWAHNGEFAIVVYSPIANDDCSGAIALTNLSNTSCVNGQNARNSVATSSATASSQAASCGTPDDDVWYKFDASTTSIALSAVGTGAFDAALQVFDGGVSPGNCGTMTSISCTNATTAGGTESLTASTVIGNTYYVRVYHAGTGSAVGETFDICVREADIVAPVIANVVATPAGNSCTSVSHTISADITDNITVASANIIWTVNGVAQTPITMVLGVAPSYSAVIPAQGTNTVNYYIQAKDNGYPAINTSSSATSAYQDAFLTTLNLSAGLDQLSTIGSTATLTATYNETLGSCLKITEITLYSSGTGQTPTYPAFMTAGAFDDLVEITNTGVTAMDLGGIHLKAEGSRTTDYTFPSASVPAGGVVIVAFGTDVNSIPNLYFNTGQTADLWSSGTNQGIWLTSASGDIIDAVAVNGWTFSVASGVSATDWTGTGATGTSGHAGTRLTGSDNNNNTGWVTAGTSTQNIGTVNEGVPLTCNPTTAYTVTWTGGNLTAPEVGNPIVTPVFAASGDYTYTATINHEGCSVSDEVVISVTGSSEKTLNITVFLEGLYAGAMTMNKAQDDMGDHFPGSVAEQITVELHNEVDYATIEHTAANVDLNTDGTAVVSIPATFSGMYWLTIKHRNSVETVSAAVVDFSGTTIDYNFSTAASQAFGDNQIDLGEGVFGIYIGDANQDGIIDGDDLVFMDPDVIAGNIGYLSSDLNGDGLVDGDDLVKGDANIIAGVALATP